MKTEIKYEKRRRKHKRVRAKIFGTKERPRFCVFRSNKHIYAQLINDESGKILLSVNDSELKKKNVPHQHTRQRGEKTSEEKTLRVGKISIAYEIGKLIAEKSLAKKIEKVVFDRGGYKYHGRVKSLAEGARKGGLKF